MRIKLLLVTGMLVVAACGRATSSTSASPRQRAMDVYLLAGQSNMAGRGVVEAQDKEPDSRVWMLDRALTWVPAVDPVHYDKPTAGVGPGRSFALAMVAHDPDVRVGLVPAAVGGSPISSWEPGALDGATNTHPYDDALVRARVALRDGTLRGILWHQGESDATPELSLRYADKLRALITRFRSDLGAPNVPFIIGQVGRFPAKPWTDARRRVDSAQRAIAASVPNVGYVSSEGLRDKGDTVHFDAASAREFGRRYAQAFIEISEKACRRENNEIPRCARDDRGTHSLRSYPRE